MKYALSTNWCSARIESGEEIAAKAIELGFDSLELGFSTTAFQAEGFKRSLGDISVGSVHAFCPLPVSAPFGNPELYTLATPDENARAIARFHLLKTVDFASSVGAGAVVLHAGRVGFGALFSRIRDTASLRAILDKCGGKTDDPAYAKALSKARKRRAAAAGKIMDVFLLELDALSRTLEERGVVLALENLPYLEGFPDEEETKTILEKLRGSPVKAWFDTGHHRVRQMHGWVDSAEPFAPAESFAGMHVNDVKDFDDDHFAPGGGNVDFAALTDFAHKIPRVVLEPKSHVGEAELSAGLARLRSLWG